jgi:prepilin signal peptidase PulO-like enzyme (type II secretory pathway)
MFDVVLISLFVFLIGLCIGSFVNVLIDRIPYNTFFSHARSQCDFCKKTLVWFDLIPLVSYIILKGKCRYCNNRLSFRMPFVETLTAISFVGIFWLYPGQLIVLPIVGLICALFIAIFFIDAEHLIIPDILIIMVGIFSILLHVIEGRSLLIYIISALSASLFFLLLFLITKGKGMGFGDVKFAGFIGLLLGFPHTITALYSAFLIGAVVSIFLILTKRKKLKGSIISFGPFMVLGVLVAVLGNEYILQLFF